MNDLFAANDVSMDYMTKTKEVGMKLCIWTCSMLEYCLIFEYCLIALQGEVFNCVRFF